MKILLITQWYKPVKAAASNRTSRIAKYFSDKGHKVLVLTGMPNYPTGILPEKYRRKLWYKETIDDIDVLRTYEYPAPNTGVFKRLINNLSFAFSASIASIFLTNFDVILVSSPAFLAGIPGLFAKRLMKARFFFDVRDLWPDSAIELGFVKKKWILNFLISLEKKYYRAATNILTATPSIREHLLSEGLEKDKVVTLVNSVDTDKFSPQKTNKKEYGFEENDFIISYTGNHGAAQGLEVTLKAAKILKNKSQIKFLFVGEGEEKVNLIAFAKREKLVNLVFKNEVTAEEIIKIINVSDLGNISLASNKIFQEAIPSKTLEYFSCGKPVIAGIEGVLKQLIEKYDTGVVYKAGNEKEMAQKILELYENERITLKKGKNARSLALKMFSNDNFFKNLDAVFSAKKH